MGRGSFGEESGLAPVVLPCDAVPDQGLTGQARRRAQVGHSIRTGAEQRSQLLSLKRQHIAGSRQVNFRNLDQALPNPSSATFWMCQTSPVSLGVPMTTLVHPANSLLPLCLLLFPWEMGTCALRLLVIAADSPIQAGRKTAKRNKTDVLLRASRGHCCML